ncbi:MAG: hypothetical protein FWE63_06405 [Bacteroidales bacterium]|nr:hypothetical protein [Bacteroidales bacterium]
MIISFSCIVPRHIRKTYIGCYDGTLTGIDTILDLSGYFLANSFVPFRNGSLAKVCQFLVFYNDGMVFRSGVTIPVIPVFDDCNTYIQRQLYEAYSDRLGSGDWGLYELKDDIIKVQFVTRANPPVSPDSYIVRYKVIDRHTIQEVVGLGFEKSGYPPGVGETYSFMSVEKLPSSECWLKSEKWFWCDKKQYRQHKKTSKHRYSLFR